MRKKFTKLLLFTLILIAVALPFAYPITTTNISEYIPSIHAKLAFLEQTNVYLYQISKVASIAILYIILALQFVLVVPLMLAGKYVPIYIPIIGLSLILMLHIKQFVQSKHLFSRGLFSKFVGIILIVEVLAISVIITINFGKISEMINLFI